MAGRQLRPQPGHYRSESEALPVLRYFSPGLVCVMKSFPGAHRAQAVCENAPEWLAYSSPRNEVLP